MIIIMVAIILMVWHSYRRYKRDMRHYELGYSFVVDNRNNYTEEELTKWASLYVHIDPYYCDGMRAALEEHKS